MTRSSSSSRVVIRSRVLMVLLCASLVAVGLRAGCLQLLPNQKLLALSDQQSMREVEIPATRGDILDRHGKLLAGSVDVFSIYANPRQVDPNQARSIAATLSTTLDEPFHVLYQRLVSDRSFVWLSRQRSPKIRDQVKSLDLHGIGVRREPRRYYPERDLAPHVLGFTNVDGEGLEGIERRFDSTLAGAPRVVEVMRDALGHYLLFDQANEEAIVKGTSIRLTLDSAIQHASEAAIREAVKRYQAVGGMAVVLDVASADILAMAVEPHFNPNRIAKSSAAQRRNRAVTDMFEPGSTMKPFVMARALDLGSVAEDAIIFCENGELEVGGHTIRDAKPYAWLSLDQVIEKSSNIGAVRVGESVGRERLGQLLSDLGFGARSGLEFPGESPGLVRDASSWSDVGLANIAFGHGIAVSAIQLASAYRILAADGMYLAPRLVMDASERVRTPRRVFSRGSMARVRRMLRRAAGSEGTGSRSRIDGYAVAGKTGTAQKIDPIAGGYSSEAFVAVFAGFVPADDPAVVVVIAIDEPKPVHGGGVVAAPVFARVARVAMRELGKVPDESLLTENLSAEVVPEAASGALPSSQDAKLVAALAAASGGTPSFIGMTAREAVERYSQAGFRASLELIGSGVVVSQSPGPGRPLKDELRLSLSLPAVSP